MHIKIILIYCICHDFLSALGINDNKQCRMTSAEVLTVAIVSALFFNGNFDRTRLILKHDGYIPNIRYFKKKNRNHFQSIDDPVIKKNTCCYQKRFSPRADHFYRFLFYRTGL